MFQARILVGTEKGRCGGMVDAEDSKSSLGNKVLVRVQSSVMFDTYFGNKELVCFDFDGLLIDTEPLHHLAYTDVLSHLNFPLPLTFEEYCAIAHSKNRNLFAETVKAAHPHFTMPWETLRAYKTNRYRELLTKGLIKPMEGAMALVKKLHDHGIGTCIVTNSYRSDVELIAETLPFIHDIPLILAREDYPKPKPAPDGYLKALQVYNTHKEVAIGLEDSEKGMDALKAAGIPALLINQSSEITSLKDLMSDKTMK